MKAIFNGKRYDTEKATLVAGVDSPFGATDYRYHTTKLYRTDKGAWFLAGHGNACSVWARKVDNNTTCEGSGIRPISSAEAQEFLEQHEYFDEIEKYFQVEDA